MYTPKSVPEIKKKISIKELVSAWPLFIFLLRNLIILNYWIIYYKTNAWRIDWNQSHSNYRTFFSFFLPILRLILRTLTYSSIVQYHSIKFGALGRCKTMTKILIHHLSNCWNIGCNNAHIGGTFIGRCWNKRAAVVYN